MSHACPQNSLEEPWESSCLHCSPSHHPLNLPQPEHHPYLFTASPVRLTSNIQAAKSDSQFSVSVFLNSLTGFGTVTHFLKTHLTTLPPNST